MRIVKLSKRLGFESFGMRLLFRILYPYFHCKCEIPEELAYGEQPVVFVANHYNVFGPVSFILSAPFISYSWVSEDLITPEKTEESLYPGLSNMLPYLREKHVRKLSRFFSRIVCGVLRRFGSIPVSRDEPGKMIRTIRKSIEVLTEGNNILIFPETGIPEYSLTSVTDFYSGFASLGAFYQKKTGKPLCFCPVYIDELHHIIRSGEPVYYDDNGKSIPEQAEAVSDTLRDRINDLAAASRGVEKQQRAPRRLGILHFCTILRMLAVIPIAVFLRREPERVDELIRLSTELLRKIHGILCNGFGFALSVRRLYRGRKHYVKIYNSPSFYAKCALGALLSFASIEKWTQWTDFWYSACRNTKTRDVSCPTDTFHYFGEIYERAGIEETYEVPFSGRMCAVSRDVDGYLRHRYGDYMQVPPESGRMRNWYLTYDPGIYGKKERADV